MTGLLSKIFNRERDDVKDARRLYRALMAQSRLPEFYGEGRVPDSYDGRIDFLTFHMAIIMKALRGHGDNGQKLSQAIYDVMIDDFDVALREEGLSDTGVVRRIKPMANLFFVRVKSYTDGLLGSDNDLTKTIQSGHDENLSREFAAKIASYGMNLQSELSGKSLGDIAQVNFTFPRID